MGYFDPEKGVTGGPSAVWRWTKCGPKLTPSFVAAFSCNGLIVHHELFCRSIHILLKCSPTLLVEWLVYLLPRSWMQVRSISNKPWPPLIRVTTLLPGTWVSKLAFFLTPRPPQSCLSIFDTLSCSSWSSSMVTAGSILLEGVLKTWR